MNKRVLILANHDLGLYNFRKELLERLLIDGHEVYISCPYGDNIPNVINMGCHYINTTMNRHGTNPLHEYKLMSRYKKIISNIEPDIIYSYTIKPNIYGALAAKKLSIPFVANVTGLGTAIQNPGIVKNVLTKLYKIAFTKVQTVFFQNKSNQQFFIEQDIAVKKHKLLPGSGVNVDKFLPLEYPSEDKKIKFGFISRIMKDKGIEEFLKAAEYIKSKFPNTEFHICGFLDGDYEDMMDDYQQRNIIKYRGMVKNIREVFKEMHCIVHPSYHEGLSNVLLESAASARPVLASNIPGCRETFDEEISGFGFEPKNSDSLINVIEKFLRLSNEERKKMGLNGRKKVEKEFNRQIVVEKYLRELEIATEGN